MIQINLLPGGQKKRRKQAGGGLSLKLPGMGSFDRMQMFIIAAWIIGPLLIAWLYLGVRSERGDVQADLDQAIADSTRFASVIETQNSLRARQDTIAQKLSIIQEIDAGRYIWPHVLDEVSLAVPPFTWLTGIYQVEGGEAPRFQLEGRTGSLPALTRFMDALEDSPFLRNIQLVSSEQVALDGNRVANNFVLMGSYEQPSMEAIETVPLFGDTATQTATAQPEASNGTGTS